MNQFKNTNDNMDLILSPSEASLPNGKIMSNLIKNWKESMKINEKSVINVINDHIKVPALKKFYQTKDGRISYSKSTNRVPLAEMSKSHRSKLYLYKTK